MDKYASVCHKNFNFGNLFKSLTGSAFLFGIKILVVRPFNIFLHRGIGYQCHVFAWPLFSESFTWTVIKWRNS